MSFNAALSGLRAASTDLKVTGNNIANASTVGFKASRTEFGDVYASSVLGAGLNQTGGGSRVQDISQQFSQGNISFTSNELDLAVSGQGFFVLEQNDSKVYSRAGTFSIDDQGFIVNNSGAKLQGFASDRAGNFAGVTSDIQIETGNQAPKQTTNVISSLNLDSSESILQRNGVTFTSTGSAVSQPNIGQSISSATLVEGNAAISFATGSALNPTAPATVDVEFDVVLNDQTVTIKLNPTDAGVDRITRMDDLVDLINTQLLSPVDQTQESIDVFAKSNGNTLQFEAVETGSDVFISIQNGVGASLTNIGFTGTSTYASGTTTSGSLTEGLTAVFNGYPAQSFTVTGPSGNEVTYASSDGASAAETASQINNLAGISASAISKATILGGTDFSNTDGAMIISLNGQELVANNLSGIVDEINGYTNSTLPGISAELTDEGNVIITSIVGDDLKFSVSSSNTTPTAGNNLINVIGGTDLTETPVSLDAAINTDESIVVGGSVDVVVEEGYSISELNPVYSGLFTELAIRNAESYTINAFDPAIPATYNHSTSLSLYDSLGETHVMTQYFVKQEYDPNDPAKNEPNVWKMYVQIDGQNVGDPDTSLPPPQNTLATMAEFTLRFNPDGTLNTESSTELLISNWTPLNADGDISGALGPLNKLEGGGLPVADPATSSNFQLVMDNTTQFSSDFAVNNIDQNGFTTGLLTGIDIDDGGIIYARFTNGESVALSQLALANFDNPQGLQPLGDSVWAENFESGEALIGQAGTGSLGLVQAGALEDSNVDLSEQLVNLIVAQRNFQANAKTIETANQITQTIINLR